MARITFGIIALNAQPLLEYNLRAIYPFAHQIIVVEGAVRVATSLATSDGHSTDTTIEMLRGFIAREDPENKLKVVFAKDEGFENGFWPEKDAMSQAYAKRATGDWLWQVDSDEFFLEKDLRAIVAILEKDKTLNGISFPFFEFWGGFDYVANGPWYKYQFNRIPRVFRWGKGFTYSAHRPPTVLDGDGKDLKQGRWISDPKNGNDRIFVYHYSYVFPKQAQQKVGYYSHAEWTDVFRENQRWLQQNYFGLKKPMFLGEKGWPNLQWLERFSGDHPATIGALRRDISGGKIKEPMRPVQDMERLLNSPYYSLQKYLARIFLSIYWPIRSVWKRTRNAINSVLAV